MFVSSVKGAPDLVGSAGHSPFATEEALGISPADRLVVIPSPWNTTEVIAGGFRIDGRMERGGNG